MASDWLLSLVGLRFNGSPCGWGPGDAEPGEVFYCGSKIRKMHRLRPLRRSLVMEGAHSLTRSLRSFTVSRLNVTRPYHRP